MPSVDTNNLKQVLRTECLPALAGRAAYFSIADVRAWLRDGGMPCNPALVRGYMSEFMRAGVIHHAGRGWYSRLATPFTLNFEPVASLVQALSQTFPLVGFSCWSKSQIRGAVHCRIATKALNLYKLRGSVEYTIALLQERRAALIAAAAPASITRHWRTHRKCSDAR